MVIVDANPARIERLRAQLGAADAVIAELVEVLSSHVEWCELTGVEAQALVRSHASLDLARQFLDR